MRQLKFLVVAVSLLALTACMGVKVNVTKSAQAEEQRSLQGFERIEQLGSLDVRYQQADTFSVVVKAPQEVMADVETRVEGNRLIVNMKGANSVINLGVADSDDVTVCVTSPDFLGIELKGSGDFSCQGLLDTDNLDIVLRGSGDVAFHDIICDQLNVSLVGSGDVEVKRAKTLRSRVELVGSGDVEVNYDDSGVVEASLTGSGDIKLKGRVRTFTSNVRGSGDIDTDGLRISESKTETTTTSKTNITIK